MQHSCPTRRSSDLPVVIVFSRDENIATWRFMKSLSEKIIQTPDDEVKETLNPECNFCIRKTSCTALRKNINVGGVMALGSAEAAVDVRAELEWQRKAVQSAIDELDEVILGQAKLRDVIKFESDYYVMSIGVRKTRSIEAENAERVNGRSDK